MKREQQWQSTLAGVVVSLMIVAIPLRTGKLVGPLDAVTLFIPLALLATLPLAFKLKPQGALYKFLAIAMALFLFWALISIAVVSPHGSNLLTWVRYLGYFLLIPATGLITRDKRMRIMILWALCIAGFGSSLFAQYQFTHHDHYPPPLWFWESYTIPFRAYSTFENPNFFGELLVVLITASMALAGYYFKKNKILCIVVSVMIIDQVAALYITYTRGSWLALVLALFIAALIFKPKLSIPLFIATGLAALVPQVRYRFTGMFASGSSADFRLGLWKIAFKGISERPVFGGGLGDFYDVYHRVVTQYRYLYQGYQHFGAHNSYFQLAAEIGILGGLFFLATVVCVVISGVLIARQYAQDLSTRWMVALLTGGLAGFAFNALTSDSFQHPRAAIYYFVAAGVLMGFMRSKPQPAGSSAEVSAPTTRAAT